MASRILALLIWAAVAASVAYWGLRWLAQPTSVPSNATAVSLEKAARGDLRKLLAGPATASTSSIPDQSAASVLAGRIKLLGVVAPRHEGDHSGLALISLDGKPPRAIRAGAAVDADMVLLSVNQRWVDIGPATGPAMLKLELPVLPAAETGTLPAPTGVITDPPAAGSAFIDSSMSKSPEGAPSTNPQALRSVRLRPQ